MTQKEQSERVAREEKYNSIEKVRFLWLNFGKWCKYGGIWLNRCERKTRGFSLFGLVQCGKDKGNGLPRQHGWLAMTGGRIGFPVSNSLSFRVERSGIEESTHYGGAKILRLRACGASLRMTGAVGIRRAAGCRPYRVRGYLGRVRVRVMWVGDSSWVKVAAMPELCRSVTMRWMRRRCF